MEKAEEVLDTAVEKMPIENFGHYSMVLSFIDIYYELERPEKARDLIERLKVIFQEKLTYFSQFDGRQLEGILDEVERNFLMYDQLIRTATNYDDEAYVKELKSTYVSYLKLFDFLIEE